MEDIRFERHFRTPYSESYYIMQGASLQTNNRIGTIDIHFTTTAVHGTLILERELDESDLTKLIEQIDEDLVLSADMPRDDFLVSVYIGKDVGFYSDEYFADENSADDEFGADDDEALRDLVVGIALRHQFQDFAFSFSQIRVTIFLFTGIHALQVISHHDRLRRRREVEIPVIHDMQGGNQLGIGSLFEHIAGCARA